MERGKKRRRHCRGEKVRENRERCGEIKKKERGIKKERETKRCARRGILCA